MMTSAPAGERAQNVADGSIGRIVSVTGSKAIVLLDASHERGSRGPSQRPEMGTLLGIDTTNTIVLAIVSALSVPVPAQREGDSEIWIAELGLVGELHRSKDGQSFAFNRGVTIYPSLGDRVRVASGKELEYAFCGDMSGSVRVGCIRQDSTIPAMVRVDDLLGKHFAILGTTGTGKSCTTALILRSILQKNPAAHIVLLDPHNEYATAFSEWAEVVSPRNMSLPYWMLTFEEIVEVVIADPNRKAEIEILQELIPIAKGRYSSGNTRNARDEKSAVRRSGGILDHKYTVDTPVPYRISDLTALIDERMGKLENRKDLAPYRQIKSRIDAISQDPRYGFMFGSLTVYDGMAQILGRIFRVPVNNKPITILELTGLPTEIVNVVVSVLCRMTFDCALWGEGQVPVTLVCEEAHRYVPANPNMGFEPCKRAIAKIAKEGRKYGASLCIVTQRPAEIDPTILSQCNTVFALRMSNDRDQEIVTSAISDTGSGLLEFLSALGQREAIAFGDGVTLPVRIRFDELPKSALPRSSTARFSEKWQKPVGDEALLDAIVERWRASGSAIADPSQQTAMLAEAMGIQGSVAPVEEYEHISQQRHVGAQMYEDRPAARTREIADPYMAPAQPQPMRAAAPYQAAPEPGPLPQVAPRAPSYAAPMAQAPAPESPMARREGSMLRKEVGLARQPAAAAPIRRDIPPPPPADQAPATPAGSGSALKSLRDRLLQRSGAPR